MGGNCHKECYGAMVPEVMDREAAADSGKAFSFRLRPAPGLVPAGREVHVDREQWDDCRACAEFEDCYKLCMMKLALELAVSQR